VGTKRGQLVLGAAVAFVVLVLVAIIGVATGWIGSHASSASPTVGRTPTPNASPSSAISAISGSPAPTPSAAGERPTVTIPKTDDATVFARAIATMAFSYDTRTESRDAWRTALMTWLGPDGKQDTLAEARGDADRVVPESAVWQQMRELKQRASFDVTAAYVPQQAMAAQRDYGSEWPPGTSVITVRGNQRLVWDGGAQTATRSMTLFVICQPTNAFCMVDRITPQVIS
jgi:hypothetical protein